MPLFRWGAHKIRHTRSAIVARLCPMPVIIGSPRSGTTLLRLMLDSHPELAIPPETGFLPAVANLTGRGDKLREKLFNTVVNFPTEASGWSDFEIPEESFRASLAEVNPFTISDGIRAFYRQYAARFGKSRWGDKTPLYCLRMNEIRKILPEARFIHIIRDGRDAALSLRNMWFSPGWDMETQAAYWKRCVLAARRAGGGQSDYVEVRYENLIRETEATLNRICAFVDLDYDNAMLRYYMRAPSRLKEHKGRSRADGTQLLTQEQRLRQQERTTEPPNPQLISTWKAEMSVEEKGRFQFVAGDLLRDLGYEA